VAQKAVDLASVHLETQRMLSRALSLATVMLLVGWFAAEQAQAQNLEAGKSPSQIFAGTCSACHKSPRGLLKTVPPGSLPAFLRQHYTTSPDMANVLSSYLASNGASDTRYVGAQPKGGKDAAKDGAKDARSDAKPDTRSDARPAAPPDQLDRFGRRLRPAAASQEAARPEARPETRPEARPEATPEAAPDTKPDARPDSELRQAARPDVEEEATPLQAEPVRPGRNAKRFDAKRFDAKRLDAKRLARPASEQAERPAADGRVPAHATNERGPDGRRLSAKQKLTKRGRPGGEETPKDSSKDPFKEFFRDQPKGDTAKEEPSGSEPKGETAKVDSSKSDSGKPDSGPPDSARSDSGKHEEGSRQESSRPVGEAPSQSAKVESAKDGETSALRPDQAPPISPSPSPAVSASAPPPAPAGPPAPPISQ
jgi:hypothetical protein